MVVLVSGRSGVGVGSNGGLEGDGLQDMFGLVSDNWIRRRCVCCLMFVGCGDR